jgi:hypothetical protein
MHTAEKDHHVKRIIAARQSGRWTWQRKESLLTLVEARLLTPDQAAARYGFSEREIEDMRRRHALGGGPGLRQRALQEAR